MNPLRISIVMSCVALLSACVAGPVRDALPPVAGAPEAHQAQRETGLAAEAHWSLQGRIALSNGRDGGSGRIEWSQDVDRYEVSLSAPITRQSWRLSGDAHRAQLDGLEGGTRVGTDPARLLREATRWEIPVTALSSWVRGLRAAAEHGPARVQFGTDGRLSRIEQGGWTIDYSGWQAGATGVELPNRLNARQGEASVRLVIDSWGDSRAGTGTAP
jgi:outer membrane lipoprotein LolB